MSREGKTDKGVPEHGTDQGNTEDAMKSKEVCTKQSRIAELARQMPELAFTSLNHHIDMVWMREAYRRTRKNGAPGVDGQTAREYEKDLEGNLQRLINRAKSGTYRAPPVKRVYIPKGTKGEQRPIGIPTLEDKVLQRAVTMVLEPIYEQDFIKRARMDSGQTEELIKRYRRYGRRP